MASTGPRSRKEALQLVAAEVAGWMNGGVGDPRDSRYHTGFTAAQRERYDEAWAEIRRRVSEIGQPRRVKEEAP